MTAKERDLEEILSRVLHTTTDQVEPVGDGLTKIRARLTEPWLKQRWWLLRNELVVLGWLAVVRYESFLATVRAASAGEAGSGPDAGTAEGIADHGGRLRPVLGPVTAWAARLLGKAGAPRRRSVGPAMAWLRPALAVAGAVVLVVAGVFAMGPMRGAILGLENATEPGTSSTSQGGGNGSGNTNGGAAPAPGGAGTQTQGRSSSAKHGATSRTKATPSPSSCSPASTPPLNSPSPTPSSTSPSPTPDPTPTTTSPSPTPDPTATTTNGPMAGPTVARTHNWSIRTTALVVCAPTAPASPTDQAPTGA